MHAHAYETLPAVLIDASLHAVGISLFVFLMMVVVDYGNVWTDGRLTAALRGGRWRQILAASALGSAPGCLGSFLVVTMYIRGMLGFGALCACMVASSGDAAFLMLAMIPGPALVLMAILFALGLAFGGLAEWLAGRLGIQPCHACQEHGHHVEEAHCRCWPEAGVGAHWRRPLRMRFGFVAVVVVCGVGVALGVVGPAQWDWTRAAILALVALGLFVVVTVPDEYLVEHLWRHVARHHLPRVFAWTLGTLVALSLFQYFWDLDSLLSGQLAWVLLLAALVGLLPDSGPHLIFLFLFAQGSVPFSVLLTSSIVQDGHGLLPLLSVSVRDALWVKAFNLCLGLSVGYAAFALGF
jgi:hypothetical protein